MIEKALVKQTQGGALAVPDLIAEWLQYETAEGASPATLQTYKKSIDVFKGWVLANGLQDPEIVKPSDIRQYKSDLAEQYAPQTVNLRLSGVRSFFRFLVNTDRLIANPGAAVKGIKRPKSNQHKRDELTSDEIYAVMDTCRADPSAQSKRDLAILTLMAYCALRSIEIGRANIDNLRTKQDRMILEVQGKGRREADEIAVIPRDQEHVIRAWLAERKKISAGGPLFISLSNRTRGARLSLKGIRDMVKSRYNQAGVVGDKKTTHSLRHSAITTAIRNDATLLQAQSLARHKNPDTTIGYIHAVNRLDNPVEDMIRYARA
jgi:site-specific recombinase XerD